MNAYFAGAIFSQSEHGIGLVPRYMADREHTNWLVLDGKVCKEYLDLFADSAEKYVLPQLGLYDPSSEHQLPHRIILETIDLSDVAPSIVANHAIVHFSQDNFTPDILVRSLFATLGSSGLLQQLSSETVNDLLTQFCSCLSKMENRNSFKSRSISFIYPPGNL